MVSTYHNVVTQRVSKKDKETVVVCDGFADLNDPLVHMYMSRRKRMTNWYLIFFEKLLHSTVFNSVVVYRQGWEEL
jgi:hypothetical protein